jgi:hypothetical protein
MAGCGCGGGGSSAPATQWEIRYADGSTSTVRYATKTDARVALSLSGKTGTVGEVAKATV